MGRNSHLTSETHDFKRMCQRLLATRCEGSITPKWRETTIDLSASRELGFYMTTDIDFFFLNIHFPSRKIANSILCQPLSVYIQSNMSDQSKPYSPMEPVFCHKIL